MNPVPIVLALMRAHRLTFVLFTLVVALAVGMGVALTAQERALRAGSARAADKFDLIVAAPGSQTDLVLSTVFLRPTAVELLPPVELARLLVEPRALFAAPLAFGDSHDGEALVGTTAALVEHLSGGLAEGRVFSAINEAVVGAGSDLAIGEKLHAEHGHGPRLEGAGDVHGLEFTIVGRMKPTASPWDRAVIVPIEANWQVHGLPNGHPKGSTAIGPPFDPAYLPGVPAVIVRPDSVAAAYGLRSLYRTPRSTAFFPAEVLVQLYGIMGDVRRLMSMMTIVTQSLVSVTVIVGVIAMIAMYRRRFAVLRALGAPPRFIFGAIWLFIAAIVGLGAALGLVMGWGLAHLVSWGLARESGIVFAPTLGASEVLVALGILGLGLLLAVVPAWLSYRAPIVRGLQGE